MSDPIPGGIDMAMNQTHKNPSTHEPQILMWGWGDREQIGKIYVMLECGKY